VFQPKLLIVLFYVFYWVSAQFQLRSISILIKVANLVLCSVALVGFPGDGPLWIKICRNVQCDIVMYISEE